MIVQSLKKLIKKKERLEDKLYYYVKSHYFGTGDGSTLGLLVTRSYATVEQRDQELTGEQIALAQFDQSFGSFLAIGAEVISRETFLSQHQDFIPEYVKKAVRQEIETPGNFKWSAELHINYS